MTLGTSSLRMRIVIGAVSTAIITSALFGLVTFVFAYTVEDRIFGGALENEVLMQQAHWQKHNRLAEPSREYMRIFRKPSELPRDLRAQFDLNDDQTEFFGTADRYYHVSRFTLPNGGGKAIAVAEVGPYLVVRPRRDKMIKALLILSTLIALVSGGIGYFIASQAVAPLSKLAAELSAQRDEAVPVIDSSAYQTREISILATGLETAFDRVRAFVDRERAFTRDASHELRTPLAVIRSGAELLASRTPDDDVAAGPIKRIEAAAKDMGRILDLLLTLARENGAPQAIKPLLPLVERAVFYASERFSNADIRLVVNVSPDQTVPMNPVVVQLILNNIIGNAFQHANHSTLTVSGSGRFLSVTDTGPGLGDNSLLEPFRKGASSTGEGLGLSIVRRLCAQSAIGLSIATGDDAGTCFTLEFAEASETPFGKGKS